jgi:hypothetical protein
MKAIHEILLSTSVALVFCCAPVFAGRLMPQTKDKPEPARSETPAPEKTAPEKPTKPSGVSTLHIEITAGEKDKPVDSASVYVRYPKTGMFGREKLPEMDLKTNRDGIVKVPNVPRGKVLIQVMAPGWRTYGRWYDLDQSEHTIKIKLEKPTRWY